MMGWNVEGQIIFIISILSERLQTLQMMSEHSDEAEIVDLAVDLCIIVGIRRLIQDLEILKTEQFYFDVCEELFPQTSMKLYILRNDRVLTAGQKIQGVIDLISKLIQHDLSHISGLEIADGNHTHLEHFLELLKCLAKGMMIEPKKETHSAPELRRRLTQDHPNRSIFTVQGIYNEFGAMDRFIQEEQSNSNVERSHQSLITDNTPPNNGFSLPNSEESNLHHHNIPQPHSTKNNKKYFEKKKNKSRKNKNPAFQPYLQTSKKSPQSRSFPVKKYQGYEADKSLPTFVKKINQHKLRLEKEALKGIERTHRQLTSNIKQHLKNNKKEIEEMRSNIRAQITREIAQRELPLGYSLLDLPSLEKDIRKIFKAEKDYKAQIKAQETAKEKEKLKKLLNFDQLDQLYEEALRCTKQEHGKM